MGYKRFKLKISAPPQLASLGCARNVSGARSLFLLARRRSWCGDPANGKGYIMDSRLWKEIAHQKSGWIAPRQRRYLGRDSRRRLSLPLGVFANASELIGSRLNHRTRVGHEHEPAGRHRTRPIVERPLRPALDFAVFGSS